MVTILGSVRMDNSWTSITCHYQHSIQVHCDKWWKHSKKGQGWHRCMWEEIDIRFGIYYHNLDNLSVTSSGLRHFSKCQLAWCRLWRVSDIRDRACVLLDQSWSSHHRCPHDSVPDNQTAPSLSKPSKQTGHVSCSRTWTGAASASKSIWQCPITGHFALPKANNSWYLARSKQCWASSIIHLVGLSLIWIMVMACPDFNAPLFHNGRGIALLSIWANFEYWLGD